MIFSGCTVLCNNHLALVPKLFYHPFENNLLSNQFPLSLLPVPRYALICFLSPWVPIFWIYHMKAVLQYVTFCVWLFSTQCNVFQVHPSCSIYEGEPQKTWNLYIKHDVFILTCVILQSSSKYSPFDAIQLPRLFSIAQFLNSLIFLIFFKDFIYLFIFRERERKGERGEKHNVWSPLARPLLGIQPTTQACAVTGNQTSNPLVCRPAFSPPSHTSQGKKEIIFMVILRIVNKALTGVAQWVGHGPTKPKGHQFNSQSGHMPGLQVGSLIGVM